ncbi:MAG: hypothetical protein HRU09_21110 [Oligoflexales bacterium]|nr:hypothetical protein [Oligoflexales bacterium]
MLTMLKSVPSFFFVLLLAIGCGDSKGVPGLGDDDNDNDGFGLECESFNLVASEDIDQEYDEHLDEIFDELEYEEMEGLSLSKKKKNNKKDDGADECDDQGGDDGGKKGKKGKNK